MINCVKNEIVVISINKENPVFRTLVNLFNTSFTKKAGGPFFYFF